ncbi:MAG: glycoside hydrolase family 38 N-terminal domain-containing protein [Armatimonadota bacterium]
MSTMERTHTIAYAWYQNHFDLIWRRGWRRGYDHLGLWYRGYADLEESVIDRYLKLAAERGTSCMLEQAISLREYLRRHPEALPVIQQLAREGRFELQGAGEAIIDVNMCDGETMARNFASGVRYARELLGQTTYIAHHNDGFGSSAQFPQVARLCGLRGIASLSYCRPDGPYWRGLDGSTVLVALDIPGQHFFYDHCYYEPCLPCKGHGRRDGAECPSCEGTGLRLCQGVYPARDRQQPLGGYQFGTDAGNPPLSCYLVTSEEMMPDAEMPGQLAALTAEGPVEYRWGTEAKMLPLWEEALARVDEPDVSISSRVENNPVQTGCLVSRIRVKQASRRAEGAFYPAEALATLATGGNPAIAGALEPAWLQLPLLFFHDAITGTHNDVASLELLDAAEQSIEVSRQVAAQAATVVLPGAQRLDAWDGDGCIAVFNPHGQVASLSVELPATGAGYAVTDAAGTPMPVFREPALADPSARQFAPVGPDFWLKRGEAPPTSLRFLAADVPPMSAKVFKVTPRAPAAPQPLTDSVEIGGYRLGWDTHGVQSITDLASGQELLNGAAGPAGHLMLEKDIGDPWGTRDLDQGRTSCATMGRLLAARRTGDAAEIIFAGMLENGTFGREKDPRTFGLEWYQTVRLLKGLPWVEFDLEIFWTAADRRIRVAFPSRSGEDRGVYKIPYGVLTRERYEMTDNFLWSPNGDWPATHFTATQPQDDVPGIAVLNSGTPSARVEDGVLLYSVLRSPGFGHCLATRYAQEYPMPTSEIRDAGYHRFRFGLMPATGANLADILTAGYQFNRPAPAFRVPAQTRAWSSGLSVQETGAYLTAVKPGYDGGIACRLVEGLGEAREVTVTVPAGYTQAWIGNLLEEPEEQLALRNGQVSVLLRPYGIYTILLKP